MDDKELGDTADFQLPRTLQKPMHGSVAVDVDAAGQSDKGKVRGNNEDHFLIARYGRFLEPFQTNLTGDSAPTRSQDAGYALIVADGMGGGAAGEVASKLAIGALFDLALATPDWIFRADDAWFQSEIRRRADRRFEEVNEALGEHARADPSLTGFGTTMTFAINRGSQLLVAHVGDSRVYRFHQGKLDRLTRDHTVAQEEADLGFIDQEEVAGHRLRHALTKVLGDCAVSSQPDVRLANLNDGDCILLCTDGLTEMVAEVSIARILAQSSTAKLACQALVDAALAAGGRDNVTVIVARYRVTDTD